MKRKLCSLLLCLALIVSAVCVENTVQAKKAGPKLNKKKVTMYVGKTVMLKVKGTKKKVKWSSSKKKVATVSAKGKVKAKKQGTAKITAKVAGKKLVCTVTVKDKKKPVQTALVSSAAAGTSAPAAGSVPPSPSVSPTKEPLPRVIKKATFEDGVDGFTGRGISTIASVDGGKSGKALAITGRTAIWQGVGIELGEEIVPEAEYQVKAYVKTASGKEEIKCTYQWAVGGTGVFTEIASVSANSTEWAEIDQTFKANKDFSMFYIYFEIPGNASADFFVDEFELIQLTEGNPTARVELESFKSIADPMFGKTGTCISSYQMNNSTLNYLKEHYSSITPENEMKPEIIMGRRSVQGWQLTTTDEARANTQDYVIPDSYKESTIPVFHFEDADAAMKMAKENGLKVRGHTLVWHSQTPTAFFREGYSVTGAFVSKEVMDARMEMYVRSVLHHIYTVDDGAYQDVVYAWDVVNEYMNNDADANWSAVYGNRNGQGGLGTKPSYVKRAFELAHDELSKMGLRDKVKLFSNDYNTYDNTKRIIDMINWINEGREKSDWICDGVGMQSHLDIDRPTPDKYVEAVRSFIEQGFEVQITELDITINNSAGNYRDEKQTAEDQAAYVKEWTQKMVALQKETQGITCVSWWGLYDGVSWRRDSHPLLFDKNVYDPKPSYYEFINAIRGV